MPQLSACSFKDVSTLVHNICANFQLSGRYGRLTLSDISCLSDGIPLDVPFFPFDSAVRNGLFENPSRHHFKLKLFGDLTHSSTYKICLSELRLSGILRIASFVQCALLTSWNHFHLIASSGFVERLLLGAKIWLRWQKCQRHQCIVISPLMNFLSVFAWHSRMRS